MKQSQYFLNTLKEKPRDVVLKSHELMVRTSMIHKIGSGLYQYLPFGLEALRQVEEVVRQEMNRIGALECLCSAMIPKAYLEKSKRWRTFQGELFRLKDSQGAEYGLAPTHEEAFTDIAQSFISSYKMLPIILYQITEKYRDEIRPRYGVMRGREFRMKDAYSFHLDEKDLRTTYLKIRKAYECILKRLDLKYIIVRADSGSMGGAFSEEFIVLSKAGEDQVALCSSCETGSNIEKMSEKKLIDIPIEEPLTKIHTPSMKKIEDITKALGLESKQWLKSMIYGVKKSNEIDQWVMIVLRGDREVNEVKLQNVLEGEVFLPNPKHFEKKLKLPLGYLGPMSVGKLDILVDELVDEKQYYGIGANEEDYHYRGFSLDRDLKGKYKIVDIHQVIDGSICQKCDGTIKLHKGIEIGHIFNLSDAYTRAFSWSIQDQDGKSRAPVMGCYGMGIDRLLASIVEQNHDEKGILWTKESSPFDIHLITLNPKDEEIYGKSEEIYNQLKKNGYRVLWDETDNRIGYKLNNADIIGIPFQLILGKKNLLNGKLELKKRQDNSLEIIEFKDLMRQLRDYLN